MKYNPDTHEVFQNRATLKLIYLARDQAALHRANPDLVNAWRPLTPAYVQELERRRQSFEVNARTLDGGHDGATAFILGGGESTFGHFSRKAFEAAGMQHCWSDTELVALRNSLTIGVNLPPTFLDPTYVFAGDGTIDYRGRGLWRAFVERVRRAREQQSSCVIMNLYVDLPDGYEPDYRIIRRDVFDPGERIVKGVAWNRSSAMGAADLARLMGCKRIILLGADYNGRGHHYDGQVKDQCSDPKFEWGDWERIRDEFTIMYEEFNKRGVEVLLGNPQSRLDMIPKVDIHEWLKTYTTPSERVRPIMPSLIDTATSSNARRAIAVSPMDPALADVPLVTVIVPNFNRWSYVSRNLPALLHATAYPRKRIEAVIINDGPQQPTPTERERFERECWSLGGYTILDTGNTGYRCCTPARNMAIRAACGDILFFTEPEIVHNADSISIAVAAIQDDPKCFVGPTAAHMYDRWLPFRAPEHAGELHAAVHFAFAVRREVMMELRGYDDGFTEWGWSDQDMFWRLERHGLRLRRPDGLAVKHEDHPRPAGVTATKQVKRQERMAKDTTSPVIRNGPEWYDGPGSRADDAAKWKSRNDVCSAI